MSEVPPPEADAAPSPDAPGAEGDPDDAVVEATQPDPVRDELVDRLNSALGEAVVETAVQNGDVWVRVDRASWRPAMRYLKDHGFSYFCFLSGLDWLPSPELATRYEQVFDPPEAPDEEAAVPAMEAGVAGGDTRFQVFARVYDVERHLGVTVKADLDDHAPSVESIVSVYRGADWHERETWEMFGFDFVGHPSLRHLYLPTEFEGFPLRKDFPLLARVVKPWPGLVDKEPVPGEDEEEGAAAP